MKATSRPNRIHNLAGRQFGRLTVSGDYIRRNGKTYWPCRCSCGGTSTVWAATLLNGHTQSCGCLKLTACVTHGMTGSPEYSSWRNMIGRCTYPSHPNYPEYGGAGVTVCDRWRTSFEAFIADMGLKPSPKHEIDRFPNQSGGYEPGNCRWATRKEQLRNLRTNRLVTFDGITLPVIDWCERNGLKKTTLLARLNRGWSVEDAITIPVVGRRGRRR